MQKEKGWTNQSSPKNRGSGQAGAEDDADVVDPERRVDITPPRTLPAAYKPAPRTTVELEWWVKGPNMARGGVNSLFTNSTNSL